MNTLTDLRGMTLTSSLKASKSGATKFAHFSNLTASTSIGRSFPVESVGNLAIQSIFNDTSHHPYPGIELVYSRVEVSESIGLNKKLWDRIERLFGVWADRTDLDDAWLDNLRGKWDERLADIYGIDEK